MPIAAVDQSFAFKDGWPGPQPGPGPAPAPEPPPVAPDADPLAELVGTWKGAGFNAIWRPHFPIAQSDHVLMLSLTEENITFSRIAGTIPNRGLLQGDIEMTGITYMDQIADIAGNGLHIEPGIWAVVPATTNPDVPESVVRMASIPHGTTILAQGSFATSAGAPAIPAATLIPTTVNGGQATDFSERSAAAAPAPFRLPQTLPPEITQPVLDDPNSLLRNQLAGLTITSTTTLSVSTTNAPIPGGASANTAFLAGLQAGEEGGNAAATSVTAVFWIEEVAANGDTPGFKQLQYTQTVMLDFAGLHWPHVTIGTLRQISSGPTPVVPAPPEVTV